MLGNKLTTDQINEALMATSGDRGKASKLLGIERPDLNRYIQSRPSLKSRWAKRWDYSRFKPADIDPKLANEDAEAVLLDQQQKQAVLIHRVCRQRMKSNMQEMSLTQAETDRSFALMAFHKKNHARMQSLLRGATGVTAVKLMSMSEEMEERRRKVWEELENVPDGMDKTTWATLLFRREELYITTQLSIAKELRELHALADKTELAKLAFEAKKRAVPGANRPGFSPIQVNVTGGKVELHGDAGEQKEVDPMDDPPLLPHEVESALKQPEDGDGG